MQINNNVALQGRFSTMQKNETNRKKADEKNNPAQSATDSYLDRIENLEEQIKKVQENDKYDDETKKEKIKELTKQIEEVKLAEEQRKLNELKNGKDEDKDGKVDKDEEVKNGNSANNDKKANKGFKDAEEENYSENFDGDKLTLSEDMKEMLKNAENLKKTEAKNDAKDSLKKEARVLEREIEVDRGRAANPKRKEDRLLELRDRVDDLDKNKLEKATSVDKENGKRIADNAEEVDPDEAKARFENEKYEVENMFKVEE